MKTIFDNDKLSKFAKKNLKGLEKKFTNNLYPSLSAIIDYEIKIETNLFKVYKVLLASFERTDEGIAYTINKAHAITNVDDNIIYISPKFYAHSTINPHPINVIDFITPSPTSTCEENFNMDLQRAFNRLLEYISAVENKNQELER